MTRHIDRIPGGKADKRQPSEFNRTELARGTKHELEHTNDRRIAQEIAMDHLAEDKRYYQKLALIEPNPRRPPRGWFRRCMKGVEKSGARNPNAVCGSVWYHKLSQADRNRITRESEYGENPKVSDNGLALTVVAAGAAATLLWFLTRPAKASAGPDCPAGSDIIAYANSRGMAVTLFGGLPTSAPPAGYNAATAAAERIYNTQDCTFYKWQSFDGSKNAWAKDTKLTTEFNVWMAAK